ncbi:MAG: hypothetical protein ACFFBD_28745, partial [Candidatus Hodarchaeota archaeon]
EEGLISSDHIHLGSGGKIRGPIIAKTVVIGTGSKVEDIWGESITLETACSAKNLYGEEIVIETACRIKGEVLYTEEIEVDETARLSKNPEKVDQLPSPPDLNIPEDL